MKKPMKKVLGVLTGVFLIQILIKGVVNMFTFTTKSIIAYSFADRVYHHGYPIEKVPELLNLQETVQEIIDEWDRLAKEAEEEAEEEVPEEPVDEEPIE